MPGDPEVLDPDQVEPAGDIGGGLLGPVLAPVGLAGAQPGESQPHPPAAAGAAPRPGQRALQPPQALALPRGQARDVQQVPGRQRRRHRHAPVDAHDLAGARAGTGAGMAANAACQRPARSMVTR